MGLCLKGICRVSGCSIPVVRIHAGDKENIGVSYRGSMYPWGGYGVGSIPATPTFSLSGSVGHFLYRPSLIAYSDCILFTETAQSLALLVRLATHSAPRHSLNSPEDTVSVRHLTDAVHLSQSTIRLIVKGLAKLHTSLLTGYPDILFVRKFGSLNPQTIYSLS